MRCIRLFVLAAALAQACTCGDPPLEPGELIGDGFLGVRALGPSSVELRLSRPVDAATAVPSSFTVADYTRVPPVDVGVDDVALADDKTLRITTVGTLTPGTRYTLGIAGLRDSAGRALDGTLNFEVGGQGGVVSVEVVVADVETARLHAGGLVALATVGADGGFSEQLVAWPVVDEGARFVARLDVLTDAARTLDPGDDADPRVDRRPWAVLLVDSAGRMASSLVRFVVPADGASAGDAPVAVPVDVTPPLEVVDAPEADVLPAPPEDAAPDDGLRQVRVVVDDRASRELVSPALKVAFREDGSFDASFPRTLPLTPMGGDDEGYWEVVVGVRVDPARTADGSTAETFPYFAFLVEEGQPYEALDVAIVAPDEAPATVRLALGNPAWTPVTFRVDVSRAYVTSDGGVRGHWPDESIFLTGEWQQAVDALGNNCGDAFTGGENGCLEMRELTDHPGVWQRTLWLPGGRPYGWKVVRCAAGAGCGELNNLVSSSGRAFATVMKNLATDNVDAFADPAVGIVDPLAPEATEAGGEVRDYTNATVYEGEGVGSEPDPAGTPDGARLFKQEVPDLVVVVAAQPIKTRVIHVGTWRDVNLGSSPQDLVDQQLSVDLNPSDYDDGFIGRLPPSRAEP